MAIVNLRDVKTQVFYLQSLCLLSTVKVRNSWLVNHHKYIWNDHTYLLINILGAAYHIVGVLALFYISLLFFLTFLNIF